MTSSDRHGFTDTTVSDDDDGSVIRRDDVTRRHVPLKHRRQTSDALFESWPFNAGRRRQSPIESDSTTTSCMTSASSMTSRGRPDGGYHVRHVTGQSNVSTLYQNNKPKYNKDEMRKIKEKEKRQRRHQNQKQLNAYTTWVNSHLKKRTGSRQIHDLKLDIRDGVALIQLLETLSGEYLGGNAFPQSYNDMRDNVQRVINYMQERRIRMHQTQASDIVEGNIKSIMRLVLAVAVHYQPDSVKQSVHQQVRHDQSAVMETAQQAAVALAETRREVINLGHVVRRPELARSSDDSHADYANIDSRTHAGSTPAYPHYKPHNAGTVPVYPHSKARDMDSIDRRGSRESLDARNANYQSHDGRNSKFRSNGSKENLDRRDSRENLDRRDSREHLDRRDSRENLDRRDSRENLDRRDSREKLDRRDLPAHDRVDGRTHSRQTAPRAVKQRSRSRDNLLETSDSDKSEIRDRRVDPRRGFVENRGVESRYAVPWRVEPRGVENRNVRNVRASSLVKSRSLDFDNVSSEDSHSEASSAASMPRSVSIQPLTSTRTPNTPTNASTAPHRTVGTRAPVRPYAPVVSLAPSLDSTRTLYTPSAPAPSLASTGANNTPTGAPVTPTGAMTSSNTTYIPPAPNTTLVDAQDVTEFSHVAHSASTSGASYLDDAMVELLDNLSVDHTDMAEDLTETKQVLLQLQNLLLQGDGEDMTSLGQDDDTTDTHDIQEELVILRKRLVQSEVASRSLHEDFARMKAENQKLLNEKTTLKQRLHDEEGTRLEMKAELIRVGLTEGTWHNERAELHKQVNEKEMFIRELKRDLAYKDRLISQLQTDLDAEIEDKENVSRHLKSQLQQLHDKMRRVGESEAQISSKLANQDQAMTRIEGKMTTQRTTPQDQTYQEEFEHMKELLISLRQNLSRNDPQHKAMDCLEGALTRLATQIHFSITLPGRKTSDPNRRVPLDTSNEPRCSPVAAVQGFPVQHQYNKPYQPIPPRQYHDVTANTYKSDMTASTTSQGYPHGTLNTTTSQGYPNGTLNTTSQGYPHGTLNTTTSQGYPHTTLNTTTSQGYPHATLNTTTSQGYPHATPNTTTSHFSGYPHANPNNTAMSPTSQPGTKNVTSSSSVTSSSHSVTSSSQTKILYFTDTTVTPFLCTIPKRLGEITLADFKLVYDKPGKFRYHFKSMDPEFGTVKEEISCDDDVLPGWEGKVVAWIEEDHG